VGERDCSTLNRLWHRVSQAIAGVAEIRLSVVRRVSGMPAVRMVLEGFRAESGQRDESPQLPARGAVNSCDEVHGHIGVGQPGVGECGPQLCA
jgi:hypothetical protein